MNSDLKLEIKSSEINPHICDKKITLTPYRGYNHDPYPIVFLKSLRYWIVDKTFPIVEIRHCPYCGERLT